MENRLYKIQEQVTSGWVDIDEPNTISEVRYDVLLVSGSQTDLKYNRTGSHTSNNPKGASKDGLRHR